MIFKLIFKKGLFLFILLVLVSCHPQNKKDMAKQKINFYDLQVNDPNGVPILCSNFKNRVVLIVNTATQCGLTPQFEGLEKLYKKYHHQGLDIIGFPCNQFMNQEPLSNSEMIKTCKLNHGVTFPLTEKIDVNGKNTHPVFQYLKNELTGFLGSKIKWNFTKFLIDRNGNPVKRFAPTTKPDDIEGDILKLL